MSKIVDFKESPMKEHLHVYTKKQSLESESSGKYMVPFHKDNGLYLLITPFPGHGLKIQTNSGEIINTDQIKSDSLLILLGRGMTDWLLLDHSNRNDFYAVPHGVEPMDKPGTRSVFARMKVVPLDSVPLNQSIPFKTVFFNEDGNSNKNKMSDEKILGKIFIYSFK